MAAVANQAFSFCKVSRSSSAKPPTPSKAAAFQSGGKKPKVCDGAAVRSRFVPPIRAMEASDAARRADDAANQSLVDSVGKDCGGFSGKNTVEVATVGSSTNIVWHKCSVEKCDREEMLNQKGCVVWITGLSGSGKSIECDAPLNDFASTFLGKRGSAKVAASKPKKPQASNSR